jgi:hypothetical protein
MRLKRGLLLICFVTFACASNNSSTPTPSGSPNAATQASSKSQTETIQSASGEKCVIDVKRVCAEGTPAVLNDPFEPFGAGYTRENRRG